MLRAALMAIAVGLPVPAGAGPTVADDSRRFADELFARGDWYRASTEYQRVLSVEPGAADAGELAFKAALCSHRAGRHTEAEGMFAALATRTSSTELQDRCRLYLAAGKYLDERWDDAHTIAAAARTASPDSIHGDRLAYLDGLSLLHGEGWAGARTAFAAVPAGSHLHPSAGELAALAARGASLHDRSPWTTGALSALLPGLGQIACGYHWDGLSALLLTGVSAALIVDGTRRHRSGVTTTGIVFGAIFYPANVLGGANAARRANRQARATLVDAADHLSVLALD